MAFYCSHFAKIGIMRSLISQNTQLTVNPTDLRLPDWKY